MHTITINLSDPQNGAVSPAIYGQFIEQLGDCVKGGIYQKGSRFSDENGIRQDVLQKVKELAPPIIRFPGGTVMSIYHWQDAIGPLESRKRKQNLIWGGVLSPEFGTAEFVSYCRAVGAEPMLCVNMASGTAEEAGAWVEYCNGTGDTYYANLRRSHGYEQPFGVKYWCIGNECYAEPDIGLQNDVQVYIKEAREFIKFMKLTDPTIQTILVGSDDIEGWDRPVLDALQNMTDYLSYHFYAAEGDMGLYGPFWGEKEYLRNVEKIEALLSSYPEQPVNHSVWYRFPARQGKIKLLIDEWNIWQYQDDGIYGLHMQYNWRDAIWVASMLNRFIADEQIAGCNMAQLCNIIAPILADDNGCYTQTIFTPCAAYRKQMYGKRLAVAIDGQYQIADEKAGEIEAVSAAAVEKDGTLHLAVVNRDFTNSIAVLLPVKAQGILYHAAPEAKNTNQTDCVQQTAVSVTPGEPFLLPAGGLLLL